MMKRSRFIEQQIAFALHQAEQGTSIGEITRKMGITEQTFYRWKKKYGPFAFLWVCESQTLKSLALIVLQGKPEPTHFENNRSVFI